VKNSRKICEDKRGWRRRQIIGGALVRCGEIKQMAARGGKPNRMSKIVGQMACQQGRSEAPAR
jgi:hypothetical protein